MIVLPDEPVLRRLGLRLQRGVIPEASPAGSRRGPRLGSSREFIGLRAYQFGDDLRDLDRAATLRFNRAHIRQYRQEVEASLVLLLDASSSMAFGDPSKFEYGQALAAALGGLALAHHDRVGAAIFGETLSASLPAGRGHGQWRALRELLEAVTPRGLTAFAETAAWLPRLGTLRGVAVVLSDFSPPEAFGPGLGRLARSGLSVVALHLLSPQELDPRLEGEVELADIETGAVRSGWIGAAQRAAYRAALDGLRREVASLCDDAGVRRVEIWTAIPLLRCLRETLVRAGVLARTRA